MAASIYGVAVFRAWHGWDIQDELKKFRNIRRRDRFELSGTQWHLAQQGQVAPAEFQRLKSFSICWQLVYHCYTKTETPGG